MRWNEQSSKRPASKRPASKRPAFTLIELLIVIAIIAVLSALGSAAYFYAIGRQYEKNTNATVEHVYGVFKQKWTQVIAESKKEPIPDSVRLLAEPDPSGERAQVMWVMLRLAEAFPTSYAEIKAPAVTTIPGVARKYSVTYYSKWSKWGKIGGPPQNESSACLFLALTTTKGSGALNPDQMPVKPRDLDGDGLPEICDAWGHPLAFFRYPYANAKLAGQAPILTGPKGTYFNPLDPKKTLQDTWVLAANRTTFENAIRFEIGNWYTAPTIVSGGSDNTLDLTFSNGRGFADMSELAPGTTKDNIYSFDIVAP